ncbi:MAG: thioesterase family protein [Aurantimonas endophytica]|uniref:acyl-CoA thioesterase n=1 Tax=Aurantimonas endophytica TaxID=1522175 RepID=UPI0030024BBD
MSWAPTVSLSWMWGLGFFYSMHIVWIQGWTGFWVFALANACGLGLFGVVLGSRRRDPETLFGRIGPRFVSLFLLCQVGAVAITLFSLGTYFWPLLFPGADASTRLALTALVVALACIIGHANTLRRLSFLHIGYLFIAAAAIAIAWATMPATPVSAVAVDTPATLSVWTFLLPTLVGFALGPWGDLQQWQRAIEIRRSGSSAVVAYVGGALIFLGLLVANAVLSRSAGLHILVGTDGAIGAQSSVAARFAAEGVGVGLIALAVWAAIAAISTIDSFYCAARWYLSSLLAKSMHPALAFVPLAAATSPLWLLGVAIVAAVTMSDLGLSQTAYIMPYATLLVGATACLLAECILRPVRFDSVACYLFGVAAGLVFFIGYREGIPFLVPLSTAIALVGAVMPIRSMLGERSELLPARAAEMAAKAIDRGDTGGETSADGLAHAVSPGAMATANSNTTPAYGFDGQWFVMQVTPTYDDTNSVGNVYFANYVRWVGKARELFFNACMPNFDLGTTRYLVLTKSFEHDFRREIAEFEPVTIRVRIARHNRKFVTLGHEILSDRHGLLGRGEQALMFVDRESFKPLDIPGDIIRGFLPFWPSNRPESTVPSVQDGSRMAG